MRLSIISLLLTILLLPTFANALTAKLDTNSFFKGQTISISGIGSGEVLVAGQLGNREILEQKLKVDQYGKYAFSRSIGFLDPSGNWKIRIKDAIESAEFSIMVYPSRQSEFLVINVLSPSTEKFARGDKVKLNVFLTDAGNPVEDATIAYWDPQGIRQIMIPQRGGYYISELEIPQSAELGKWWLFFTAETFSKEKQTIGGEIIIELEFVQSLINVEIIEPNFKEIKLGGDVPFKIKLSYSDGSSVEGANVFVNVRDHNFSLQGSENIFEGSYTPRGDDAGLLKIKLIATDKIGNRSEKVLPITVSGWFEWFVATNILWILALVLILGFILLTSTERIYVLAKHRLLEAKKLALIEEKKHIQSQYFKHGAISQETYRDKELELATVISNIEAELFQLKAKMEDIRHSKPNFELMSELLREWMRKKG